MEIVKTLLIQTKDIWLAYCGNSIFMYLFLAALIYLFLTERNKGNKTILVYTSFCLLGLFFFPVFSYMMVCKVFDLEVYYRFLWMLPTAIVTALAGVRLVSSIKSRLWKTAVSLALVVCLAWGGNYTYDNPTFEKAENAYKLPQEVIDICNAVLKGNEGRWVRAVFPQEMLSLVRQYTNDIHMPYGREMIIPRWGNYHPLFDAMQAEKIDARNLAELARDAFCEYIVLEENRNMAGTLEKYSFDPIETIDNFIIYRDALYGE